MLAWSLQRSLPPAINYALTTLLIVGVGVFRALVFGSIVPWLLFIPVVLAMGLLFGRGPGVYATILAAIIAGLSIGDASKPAWLTEAQWTGSILFVLVASGIAVLAAELRAAFARATRLALERETANVQLAEREASLASVLAALRENEEALRNLAAELALEQATLKAVFQSAPVGLSLAAANGKSVLLNEQMQRLLGRDISKGGIDRYLGAGAIHQDGSPYMLAEYPQVIAVQHGVETYAAPFLIERPDGSRLRTEISSVPLRDGKSAVTGAVSVVVDVEERERAIEHQTMLTGELAHRMKNMIAIVQAIVQQSLRSEGTLAEVRERVLSRFEALVRAQDMLTQAEWKLTDLAAVAQNALETVNQDGHLTIEGPPVEVGARAALSFTLVLHELATNALKYGSLSVPEGRVEICWHIKPAEAGQCVSLSWTEFGGPVVFPPTRKGFGTRLIDTMGRTFGGRSELRYDPTGVRWLVEADAGKLKIA